MEASTRSHLIRKCLPEMPKPMKIAPNQAMPPFSVMGIYGGKVYDPVCTECIRGLA